MRDSRAARASIPTRARSIRCATAVAITAATVAATLVGGAGAGAQLAATSSIAAAPADAAANPRASYLAVACTGVNGCVEAGTYETASGHVEPALAYSVDGAAYGAIRVPLPGDARANPAGTLRAISCSAPGACVAVGDYVTAGGRTTGVVTAWAQGALQLRASPPIPPGAAANPRELLGADACSSTVHCDIAGTFATTSGRTEAVLDRLRGTAWLPPLVVAMPPGAAPDPRATVAAMACAPAGACEIVGTYSMASGATAPFTDAIVRDAASRAARLALPTTAAASPSPTVGGVACPTPGGCVVVGTYRTTAHATVPVAFLQSPRGWGATQIALPRGHNAAALAVMGSVSCASAAMCLASGSYVTVAGARVGATATLVGARWQPFVAVTAPAGVTTTRLGLPAVSCTPSRACTVAGQVDTATGTTFAVTAAAYLPPSPPRNVQVQQGPGRAATVRWSAAVVPGSGISGYLVWRRLGTGGPVLLGESSTTAFVDRSAIAYRVHYVYSVASYADDHQVSVAVAVPLATFAPASAPQSVRATPGHKSATVRWNAPASNGGTAITSYQISVSWQGGGESAAVPVSSLAVTLTGLPSHVTVTVRVAAVTEAGAGASSAPVTVVPT